MALKSKELNRLHKLKLKVRLLSDDIWFLSMCRKRKVFPKFMKVKLPRPMNSKFVKKIEENTKRNWLNCEIKLLYSKQADLELQALELHLLIIKNMDSRNYELFNEHFQKNDFCYQA